MMPATTTGSVASLLIRANWRRLIPDEMIKRIESNIGFTRQVDFTPHGLTLIKPNGLTISLIKPQYEVSGRELVRGRLTQDLTDRIVNRAADQTRQLGANV